jgi:MFS family permease
MQTFLLISFGQLASLIGSGLTRFALGVWVFQTTGSVTQFALLNLFSYLPTIAISPLAGALVDRWDRRWVMILSDSASGLGTVAIALFIYNDGLQIWHIYAVACVSAFFSAFQWPAYAAATTVLVPKQHLSRANGVVQISKGAAKIAAPALSGFLLLTIQLQGIVLIDIITFLFAVGTLLAVKFPKPEKLPHSEEAYGWQHLIAETQQGWHYIAQRPGMLALASFLTVPYFSLGVLDVLFWPFVLTFTTSADLGLILSFGGCGWLVGSVAMSTWGGPKPRIYGVLLFVAFQGTLLLFGWVQPTVPIAAFGVFVYLCAYPIVVSSSQTIWHQKVPTDLQGRVFALLQGMEKTAAIAAYTISGPLVDKVLGPMLSPGGLLADRVGRFVGVGEGRGMAFFFILIGVLNLVATGVAYRYRRLRRLELEIPDAIADEDESAAIEVMN